MTWHTHINILFEIMDTYELKQKYYIQAAIPKMDLEGWIRHLHIKYKQKLKMNICQIKYSINIKVLQINILFESSLIVINLSAKYIFCPIKWDTDEEVISVTIFCCHKFSDWYQVQKKFICIHIIKNKTCFHFKFLKRLAQNDIVNVLSTWNYIFSSFVFHPIFIIPLLHNMTQHPVSFIGNED